LHTLAKVPLLKCGIEEIKKFQAVMPEYQIHVSKEHFNGIIALAPQILSLFLIVIKHGFVFKERSKSTN
jgi:hypothetical protein